MTIHLMQNGRNSTCILGTNPIEFEAISNQNNDLAEIFSNGCRQRFDPSIELLFREFLGQLIDTGLP